MHMASTIETLKKVKKQALDSGVRFAVENHAGDLHSRELVKLIEKAGPEFVGATIDTGNSTWTLKIRLKLSATSPHMPLVAASVTPWFGQVKRG